MFTKSDLLVHVRLPEVEQRAGVGVRTPRILAPEAIVRVPTL